MRQCGVAQKPVEVLPLGQLQFAIGTQELKHRIRRSRRLTRPNQKFCPAPCTQDRNFLYALRSFELPEDFVSSIVADPETFSHRQRRGVMVQSNHHESRFHEKHLGLRVTTLKSHARCQTDPQRRWTYVLIFKE